MMSAQETQIEATTSNVPLYATQGGGYASYVNGKFVWHSEIPDFMIAEGAKIGDEIPEEWGTAAINTAAQREMEPEDQTDGHYYDPNEYWDEYWS
jgi:hypothetical protein